MPHLPPDLPIYLERLDSAQHMARFYWIGIEPTLFGDWAAVCRWGRIGTGGQRQEEWFTTQAAATEAAHAALARKRRRSYRTPAEWRRARHSATLDTNEQGNAMATPAVGSRADRRSAPHRQHELDLG